MSATKQNVNINFSQGLDTKSDPFQVPLGKFLGLSNSIFTKAGLLQKRNGFGALAGLPDDTFTYTTTFNGNLTAVGNKLAALSDGTQTWVEKGNIQPVKLDTLPLIRSNLNQTQCDSAIAPNGLVCTVFTDTGGSVTPQYKYVIADRTTGQNVVTPTVISAASGTITGSPRVFVLGGNFIIVFSNLITATYHLQYIAQSYILPLKDNGTPNASVAADLVSAYVPATTLSWDGVVANNALYFAWNNTAGGQSIKINFLTSNLTLGGSPRTFASQICTIMSVCADITGNTPVIWASYFDAAGHTGHVVAVDTRLNVVLAATTWVASGTILNVTSAAQSGSVTIFAEVSNAYGYDSGVATNFVRYRTCTQGGSLGTATVLARSVGLASKAFILNSTIYLMAVYSSAYQPTYFLCDAVGNVISKLAYSNGGGYLTLGLPSVTVDDDTASVAYLFRDLIEPVNKDQGASNAGLGVYAQTGINLATFTVTTEGVLTAEIGNDLHLSGGFLWMYDGYVPVEHGFHLWPDNVEADGSSTSGSLAVASSNPYFYVATYEWSDNQGNLFRSAPSIPYQFIVKTAPANFTGDTTNGSPIIINVSSIANLQVGQHITGTGIPASSFILSIDSASQITITHNASATNSGVTITPSSVTSAAINVPTLRLTYKTANPVKIVLYRWSTAQQTYYAITPASSTPTLNDITVDYVTITDTNSDAQIIGNDILYTTGGVVENIAAPATSAMALYKSRLMLLNAEDKNLVWYSKQVIENTPVDMSALFTIYIAPTTAAQGNTGPVRALSAMDDKLIIFKKDAIYYMTGDGPDNTGANNDFSAPIFITSTVGSSNQASIVFIPDGLLFQSDKGIWLLGRDLSTSYIGAPVEAYNDSPVLSSLNIPGTNQVRFTLANGVTLMYDYYYKQWGTFNNIPAISSCLYQGLHTFINESGLVYQETLGKYLDGSNPVLLSFSTSWINLAGLQGFQRAHFFYLLGTYLTPHKLNIGIAYDYAPAPAETVLISPTNYSGAFGSDSIYGQSTPFGGSPSLEAWRVFLTKQRCQSFQIILNEIYDSSFGVPAGQGLTLSGLNLVLSIQRGWRTQSAGHSIGAQ